MCALMGVGQCCLECKWNYLNMFALGEVCLRCYRWLENRKGKHKEDKEMQTHTNTLKEKKEKKETWHTKRSDLTEDDKLKHVSQKISNQMSQQRDHESTGPQI